MLAAACLTGLPVFSPAAFAQSGRTDVIAGENDPDPDGSGTLRSVTSGVLNNAGQVAFRAGNQSQRGLFRGAGGVLTQIVRFGDFAPDGNGTFDQFGGDRR